MKYTVIIPARFQSSRLPGKPLADIAGKPMIQRVYESASASDAEQIIVATDNQKVFDTVKGFGGEVCMTSETHESGTDRLQEVAAQYHFDEEHIVVNVQGDEPLIPAAVINQVARNLDSNPDVSAATLSESITNKTVLFDPNCVKVVADKNGRACYFSRAPIPWVRDAFAEGAESLPDSPLFQRHIGIYAYRVGMLNRFVQWPIGGLESLEKLEQLRILENGENIHVQEACEVVPGGVDTPEDLIRIQAEFGV
ncbi:3-deoxy-manno-octulosonate cytidylyltransferase [Teredinibacter sp. KSP-S5-2]|uniref:3-deoxy-manno-octulosonate cytidylyltransferase n=1 Tax=Teredinibacter sp. KSP-S5-2 TaxID=3034506 RepID=UPI0029345DEE|nr:3-deoxy-manno-octulosonate cytidylyltransferase [Teredinibacter sp. KSP-S5-2]WNO11260.1 3-deoxy-manno-octulosonate cytidylyltransferase [Teredinibacter sp. KSP-S5-2]